MVAPLKPTYDWVEIKAYYDSGNSYGECRKKFGFTARTWESAIKSGRIISRGQVLVPLSELLVEGRRCNSPHLKARLIREGYLEDKCSECGQIPIWNGKPLVLQLDHRNGIKSDNRLENLRILCPHCHTQTSTYGSKSPTYKHRNQYSPVV